MKSFLKVLGAVIVLIGVAILAIHHFEATHSNTLLVCGGATMIIGVAVQIITNKMIVD